MTNNQPIDERERFAILIEELLPMLKATPSKGYREREMRLVVDDVCDAGGQQVGAVIFDDGDAELLIAALRYHASVSKAYVHLSARGKDPNEKCFTKHDVEALVGIGLAMERERAKSKGQWTCWKCRQVNSAFAKTCGRCEDK